MSEYPFMKHEIDLSNTIVKTKVLVVGGGPSGSTAAMYLAASGVETILLEQNLSYVKPCAGGVRSAGFHEFAIPEGLIQKRINTMTVVSPSGRKIEANLNSDICIVERVVFDKALRNVAATNGAMIIEGQFINFTQSRNSLVSEIWFNDNIHSTKIQSDFIFAAGGINCAVRKAAGLKKQKRIYTITSTIQSAHVNTCEFWLGKEHASRFYSWAFPAANGVSIGTGSENPRELHRLLDTFTQRKYGRSLRQLSGDSLCDRPRVFPIPKWSGDKLRHKNILLIGDAAGTVMPVTGEGIYFGMKSGKYAAMSVISKQPDMYQRLWDSNVLKSFTDMASFSDQVLTSDEAVEAWIAHQFEASMARSA